MESASSMSLWPLKTPCFAHHICDVRVCVRCRTVWRGWKHLLPQMMCGCLKLCQTGRQVALSSHSRMWVSEPCCTKPPHVHTKPGICTPRAGWLTKPTLRGGWLSECFKLEMAFFPEEMDKMIRKWRGICQPHWRLCHVSTTTGPRKAEATPKSDIGSQIFARSLVFQHQKHINPHGLQPGLLWTSGPPIHSWISACVKAVMEGAGKHHVYTTQVPEGVAPSQLSLPVTCIHQLLPGPACHQQCSSTSTAMAWPCPGYPCLTPFVSVFSHLSLLHVKIHGCLTFHFCSHAMHVRSRRMESS